MNCFNGQILSIQKCDHIHYITILCSGIVLHALTLELDERFTAGHFVRLLLKETEVALLKGSIECISIANCIPSKVKEINAGKLLSEVILDTPIGFIKSVLITEKLKELALEHGSDVLSLFKASEIALSADSV